MSTGTSGQGDAEWRADWERALAELELDLVVVERILDHGEAPQIDPWTAPVMRRPMPQDLLPRAKELHRKQVELGARLAAQMNANRHQQRYTSIVDAGVDKGHRSVYLDVSA